MPDTSEIDAYLTENFFDFDQKRTLRERLRRFVLRVRTHERAAFAQLCAAEVASAVEHGRDPAGAEACLKAIFKMDK